MNSNIKNLLFVVLAGALLYFGYNYLFATDEFSFDENSEVANQLFLKTQEFITRSSQLQALNLNVEFFSDSRFISLIDYSTPVPEQEVGKSNLFDEQQAASTFSNQNSF